MSVGTMVAWFVLLAAAGTSHGTERYALDSTNTQVSFVVQHLGFQWASAQFSDINGELVLDRAGAQSRVDVTVGIASLQFKPTAMTALAVSQVPRLMVSVAQYLLSPKSQGR